MDVIGGNQGPDSGVETEFDVESNDSSLSSASIGPSPGGAALPEEEQSSTTPEPPAAPHSSPLHCSPPLPFPRPQPRGEHCSERTLGGGGSSGSCLAFPSPGLSMSQGSGGEETSNPPTSAEDGYLGDCSSDGGNEKNFPLPANWSNKTNSCSCHHSLPPSPSQQVQIDASPSVPMEDIDPPAGLQFSALMPSYDTAGGGLGYGYQILSSVERNQTHLRTKMKSTSGLRSKYNAHVGEDWSRIKAAITDRKLRIAANQNNTELVEKLCANGANTRCFDEHKRTPLHFAAANGYTEIADILLKYGADPNQKDKLGNTALHLAACTNHVPVVTLLLRAGTDITTIDNNGRTPMQLAQAKLKILQRSSSTHTEMSQVKGEVSAVLDMMKVYLKKVLESRDTARSGSPEAYTQLIDSFSQRLNLHTSHTDLSTDLGNLLQSLGTLSLNQKE